ncbi:MAG: hypothetical protein WBC17_16755, partial [Mycobacterium sp.]
MASRPGTGLVAADFRALSRRSPSALLLALSCFVEPRTAPSAPEVTGAPFAAPPADPPRAPRDCRAGVADEESPAETVVSDGVPVSADATAGKP